MTSTGIVTGGKVAKLDAAATDALFASASAALHPQPSCPEMPTDLQRTTLTLAVGGSKHSITHLKNRPCSKAAGAVETTLGSL